MRKAGAHRFEPEEVTSPWMAVVFWYPEWYPNHLYTGHPIAWHLRDAITQCNWEARRPGNYREPDFTYQMYAGCLMHTMRDHRALIRAILVAPSDSAIACEYGVIIKGFGTDDYQDRGSSFNTDIYLLPALD